VQFAITVFISAFLQPVISRFILPWYGGGTGIWTTCILFFQVGLLVGYAYAFILRNALDTNKQVIVHLSLLLISLLFLPITPTESLKPVGAVNPLTGIILLLISTVGVPYILISATGPLLQHWYSLKYHDRSPYRLYALSNAGSLLGLVSYPFIVEPLLSLENQTLIWSSAYVLFVLVCGWSGKVLIQSLSESKQSSDVTGSATKKIGFIDPLLWLSFSACGSVLLLATTNKVTQDIAVVPFLWVLPLGLYLTTFIIAFDSPRWYNRYFWLPALIVSLLLVTILLGLDHEEGRTLIASIMVAFYCGAMFVACMVCHGEMTRIKPAATYLTLFYLIVALGGALGGSFVSLLAPQIFNGLWEFHIAWVLVALLTGVAVVRHPGQSLPFVLKGAFAIFFVTAFVLLSQFMIDDINMHHEDALTERRNFYGVLRVYEKKNTANHLVRSLHHGIVNHGSQFVSPKLRSTAMAYYGLNSGVDIAITRHPKRLRQTLKGQERGLNIGIVGLGVGTLATYARPGDTVRLYEINPEVEVIAREYFSFLEDTDASVEVIPGDGRISMETELKNNGPQYFDVLVIDAFSGDSVPVHLLTLEAFELYWAHLNTDGILAVNISNYYINLRPVVKALAKYFDKPAYFVKRDEDKAKGQSDSSWILLTDNSDFMSEKLRKRLANMPGGDPENVLWTDDYSSIFNLIYNN